MTASDLEPPSSDRTSAANCDGQPTGQKVALESNEFNTREASDDTEQNETEETAIKSDKNNNCNGQGSEERKCDVASETTSQDELNAAPFQQDSQPTPVASHRNHANLHPEQHELQQQAVVSRSAPLLQQPHLVPINQQQQQHNQAAAFYHHQPQLLSWPSAPAPSCPITNQQIFYQAQLPRDHPGAFYGGVVPVPALPQGYHNFSAAAAAAAQPPQVLSHYVTAGPAIYTGPQHQHNYHQPQHQHQQQQHHFSQQQALHLPVVYNQPPWYSADKVSSSSLTLTSSDSTTRHEQQNSQASKTSKEREKSTSDNKENTDGSGSSARVDEEAQGGDAPTSVPPTETKSKTTITTKTFADATAKPDKTTTQTGKDLLIGCADKDDTCRETKASDCVVDTAAGAAAAPACGHCRDKRDELNDDEEKNKISYRQATGSSGFKGGGDSRGAVGADPDSDHGELNAFDGGSPGVNETEDQHCGLTLTDRKQQPEPEGQIDNQKVDNQKGITQTVTSELTGADQEAVNELMVAVKGKSKQKSEESSLGPEASQCEGAEKKLDHEEQVERSSNPKDEPHLKSQPVSRDLKGRRKQAPAKSLEQCNQISINGTTFYHVNAASLVLHQAQQQIPIGYPNLAAVSQPHYFNPYQALPTFAFARGPAFQLPHPPPYTQHPQANSLDYHHYYWPSASTASRPGHAAAYGNLQAVYAQAQAQLALYDPARNQMTYQMAHNLPPPTLPPPPHDYYNISAAAAVAQPPLYGPPPTSAPTATPLSVPPQPVASINQQAPPLSSSNGGGGGGGGGGGSSSSSTNNVNQLKLGYNLIPLLPISAIPTRIRQAYGMDKVWQDEFEQMFSQFISQVVWTLVEVETNPNIRSSSRILNYKSRYIVRVDGPSTATTQAPPHSPGSFDDVSDMGGSASSVPSTSGHEVDDEQGSCWNVVAGREERQNSGCPSPSENLAESNISSGDQQNGGNSSQCESDCDSGAVLNSGGSSGSETTSQELGNSIEIGLGSSSEGDSQQAVTPTSSPPCQTLDSHQSVSNKHQAGNSSICSSPSAILDTATLRKFPLKFRMFIDSAKVRFCCENCGHGWTSMKGRVVFWYELFELVDGDRYAKDRAYQSTSSSHTNNSNSLTNATGCNPSGGGGSSDGGVINLIGYCAYKLFGQQCDICKIENRFERPMWYPEEVTKVLCNLYNKIGQVYFGFRMPAIDKQRRAGKPKTSHNSLLCQACHDGVCTDRK